MQVNLWCSKTDIIGCGETLEIASLMFALGQPKPLGKLRVK